MLLIMHNVHGMLSLYTYDNKLYINKDDNSLRYLIGKKQVYQKVR